MLDLEQKKVKLEEEIEQIENEAFSQQQIDELAKEVNEIENVK